METSGGTVALAIIAGLFVVFAFTTDNIWMRVGALIVAGLAVAAFVRGRSHD